MRFLTGLFLLPPCVGLAIATGKLFFSVPSPHGNIFSGAHWAFILGAVVWMLVWLFCPRPFRTYVLGHELTHVLWGTLFGAKARKLKVGKNGGSVLLSKDNILISLSPYFFPFYTALVLLIYGIWHLFAPPVPVPLLWHFLIGITWTFHVCFTIDALCVRQPDVQSHGVLLSYAVIVAFNLLLAGMGLVFTTELTFSWYCSSIAGEVVAVYTNIWRFLRWAWDGVASAF